MKIRHTEKIEDFDHSTNTRIVTASFGWIRPFLGRKQTRNRWVKCEEFHCCHAHDCCGCCFSKKTTVVKTGKRSWHISISRSFNY